MRDPLHQLLLPLSLTLGYHHSLSLATNQQTYPEYPLSPPTLFFSPTQPTE
jgi:hypothetical protein